MANANMNIGKFLGINASGTDAKKGELSDANNFKLVDSNDCKRNAQDTYFVNVVPTGTHSWTMVWQT